MTFREFFSKLTSFYLWGHLLAMVCTIVLVVVGGYFFLDFYTHHGETIVVPNMRGQSCEVAVRKLEAAGFRVEVTDTGYIPRLPGDIILDQNLVAGAVVKVNRMIFLTVNASSARTVSLPDIADNCSLREAQMRLQSMGFKLGAVKRIAGDREWVYSVEVAGKPVHAGMRIPITQPIVLVVGDGSNEDVFNGNDSLDFVKFNRDSVVYDEVQVPIEEDYIAPEQPQ